MQQRPQRTAMSKNGGDMSDINCPYCGKSQDICHDDGFGYEENVKHEMQCSDCEKYFVFETTIIFYYEAEKADCLNGSDHNYESVKHYPIYWPDWKRCTDCGKKHKGEMVKLND